MTIDPTGDRPVYRQLADLFRDRITAGVIPGGSRLPSESEIQRRYGLGRETVRKAIGVLRGEGLVTTVQGEGTLVRTAPRPRELCLGVGEWATVRMPTELQRRQLGVDEGIPVIEVHHVDGSHELHPGDNTHIMPDRCFHGPVPVADGHREDHE